MPIQDTIAKRLMSNKNKFHVKDLNQLIFRAAADKTVGTKFLSLFPGELDSTSTVCATPGAVVQECADRVDHPSFIPGSSCHFSVCAPRNIHNKINRSGLRSRLQDRSKSLQVRRPAVLS
jgi:hypothetical protein